MSAPPLEFPELHSVLVIIQGRYYNISAVHSTLQTLTKSKTKTLKPGARWLQRWIQLYEAIHRRRTRIKRYMMLSKIINLSLTTASLKDQHHIIVGWQREYHWEVYGSGLFKSPIPACKRKERLRKTSSSLPADWGLDCMITTQECKHFKATTCYFYPLTTTGRRNAKNFQVILVRQGETSFHSTTPRLIEFYNFVLSNENLLKMLPIQA